MQTLMQMFNNLYLDWYNYFHNMQPTESFSLVIKCFITGILINYFIYDWSGIEYLSQRHQTINGLFRLLGTKEEKIGELQTGQSSIRTNSYILLIITSISVFTMLWVL